MKERLTLIVSIMVYVLCNLRLVTAVGGGLEANWAASAKATALWLFVTAPFYAGISLVAIAFLQAMSGGDKLPWDRRLRVFLAIGIICGFVMSVWENMGVNLWKHLGVTLASYSPVAPL